MLEYLDLARLLVFLVIGAVISYQDLKERTISNKHLSILLVAGFLAGFFYYLYTFDFELFSQFLLNFCLAFLVGFFFWKLGFWGAGDAKFFLTASLYLPFLQYTVFFPSSLILINMFLLAFILWFIPTLIKTKRREKIETLRKTFTLKNVINMFLILFGLFYFISKVFSFFGLGIYAGFTSAFIFIFLLFLLFQKYLQKEAVYILLSLCILRIIFDHSSMLSFWFWLSFFLSSFILLLAIWIGNLSFYISYEEKYLDDLKEGDMPMGLIFEGKEKVDLENFLEENFGSKDVLKRGFSKEEIKKAKKLKGIKGFIIKKYISFTPFLLISTILVSIMKVDIVMFIVSLFYG